MEDFFKNLSDAIHYGARDIQWTADEFARANGLIPKERQQREAAERGHRYVIQAEDDLPLALADHYDDLMEVLDDYEKIPNLKTRVHFLNDRKDKLRGSTDVESWFDNLINVTEEIGSGKGVMRKSDLPGVVQANRERLNAAYNKFFKKV